MQKALLTTEYFQTHQEREKAFAALVDGLLPSRLDGPECFWRDFNHLIQRPGQLRPSVTFIPSDPRQCLAFNCARQVLWAAGLADAYPGSATARTIDRVAALFGLQAVLDQPIRSLSGGEAAKTALAKAWIASSSGRPLVMASPSGWMSPSNTELLEKVIDHYLGRRIPVSILAMEGEGVPDHLDVNPGFGVGDPSPILELECHQLEIGLSPKINTLSGDNVFCKVMDTRIQLASPCLITGDNGQGKSLLAKAICGAVSFKGRLHTASRGRSGPGRLIFQDVVTQALMRGASRILQSGNPRLQKDSASIYKQMQVAWQEHAARSTPPARADRLLRIKLALAAVRLASVPTVLILDEPDWGLSRRAAEAFVLAVINQAHRLKVPVVLISHKPWWSPLAKSRIKLFKQAESGQTGCKFTINLILESDRT